MQEKIFWREDAQQTRSYTSKPFPESADVAVIGGGFTGTSAALKLAKSGARVVLIEAHTIGWGASSRNGGQALSALHQTLTELVKIFGRDLARDMFLAAVQAADTVERIVREEQIACDFLRSGSIEAASKASHFSALQRERDTLAHVAGYEVNIVPKEHMATELGTDHYFGLMVNHRSAALQPAKFVQGMALAAERWGADIHEGVRVTGVSHENTLPSKNSYKFTVHTDRGPIQAQEVLLASNAWAGEIVPYFRKRVFPIESYIIATEPLPEETAKRLIPHKRVVYDTKNMLAYYQLSRENRMVWGGEGAEEGIGKEANIRKLQTGMGKVFPELLEARVDYYWGGTLGITIDSTPHAGRHDGIWYSMCYVGHGVALGTYLGEQIAKQILGEESFNPFQDLKIPAVPVYWGNPWFIDVMLNWYHIIDRLG